MQVSPQKYLEPGVASLYACIQCWHKWVVSRLYLPRDCIRQSTIRASCKSIGLITLDHLMCRNCKASRHRLLRWIQLAGWMHLGAIRIALQLLKNPHVAVRPDIGTIANPWQQLSTASWREHAADLSHISTALFRFPYHLCHCADPKPSTSLDLQLQNWQGNPNPVAGLCRVYVSTISPFSLGLSNTKSLSQSPSFIFILVSICILSCLCAWSGMC